MFFIVVANIFFNGCFFNGLFKIVFFICCFGWEEYEKEKGLEGKFGRLKLKNY